MDKSNRSSIKSEKAKKVEGISLLARFVIVFLLVVTVPTSIIGVISTRVSSKALEDQLAGSKDNLALQISNLVDDQILRISDVFFQISVSPALIDALVFQNEDEVEPSKQAQWKVDKINNLGVLGRYVQSQAVANEYIDSMTIVFSDGETAGSRLPYPEGMDDFRESVTYKTLLGHKDLYWLSPDQEDLSINKEGLIAGQAIGQDAGVIFIELNYDSFKSLLETIDIGKSDVSYLISPTGSIISTYNSTANGNLRDWELFRLIREKAATEDAGTFNAMVNGVMNIVSYNKCDSSNFIYVITISEAEVLAGSRQIRNTIVLLGATFAVLAVFGGLAYALSITKALKRLMDNMFKAADGDLTVMIESERKDEIGKVADTLNTMVSSISKLIVKSKEVSADVHSSSEELATISEDTSKTASEIANAINGIALGANKQRDEVDNSLKTFTVLADQINHVVEGTQIMETAAGNVKTYTLEGIQLSETLNNNAMDVKRITSDVVVQNDDLAKSITSINKITSILNEISDQTRLLSLNASIEAARAGESGRGFMVVAEEVGKLAEQSNIKTSEIEALVTIVFEKAKDSIKSVKEADKVIGKQTDSVEDSVEYFRKIDSATDELMENIKMIMNIIIEIANDKDLVMKSMESIAEVSEMAAASAEEVSASTEEQLSAIEVLNKMAVTLHSFASTLEEILSRFKV